MTRAAIDALLRTLIALCLGVLCLLPLGCADVAGVSSGGSTASVQSEESQVNPYAYVFRNSKLLKEHYNKHGKEMGFASKEEYEMAASSVATNPAALHKTEAEDGDDVYYLEATNEFVIVSTDGYIRTYFQPRNGKAYFDRQ